MSLSTKTQFLLKKILKLFLLSQHILLMLHENNKHRTYTVLRKAYEYESMAFRKILVLLPVNLVRKNTAT